MQNKGFRHVQSALDFSLFFSTWPPKDPFSSRKTLNFTIIRGRNTLSLLFVYEMTQDQRCAPSLPWDDTHYLNVGNRRLRGRLRHTSFSADKTLLLQHWQSNETRSHRSRPPLFLTPRALSPGADPLYMPCSSAITMTQFLLKTVLPKLQKEPALVQELLRETVPLSLTVRAAKSYSRKCFVKNFW